MYATRIIALLLALLTINTLHATNANDTKMYICTAADFKYYECLLNLIGGLHKHNFDQLQEIAVFDLGLKKEQLEFLSKIPKLKIYTIEHTNPDILTPFDTRTWGKPVPGWYTWKPVIIKQAFDIFPDDAPFMFIDAGTTISKDISDLFRHIKEKGYFFENGCDWCFKKETTDFFINALNIQSDDKKWLLADDTWGIESGIMGFTKQIYHTVVMPAYELSKDIRYFADDGTAQGSFGNARHDQTVFSYFVLLHYLQIYHHFTNPKDPFYLEFEGKKVPFHIASTPWDRTEYTNIYRSRFDINLSESFRYIKLQR